MHLKHKKRKVNLIASMVLLIMLACFPVIDVYAGNADEYFGEDKPPYSSWVADIADYPEFEEYLPDEEAWGNVKLFSMDSITKHMSKNIMYIGMGLNRIMYSGDNYGNITIDGLVLGRLASRTWDFSIAQFGLEKGNPYGVIGAHVYVVLRNAIYSLFLVYACWFLISQGFQNSSKAWLSLKEGVMGIVFAFFLTYLMPQLTSFFLAFRNWAMAAVSGEFSGVNNASLTLNSFFIQQYIDDPDSGLITAVLYVALQFANIWFIGSYITIAVQCAILFGIFPSAAVLSLKQKKFMTDWCSLFFSSLAVPLIDYVLLIIPTMITEATGTTNYVTAIISLFVVWNIIPARNAVLRLFGNATATNAGRGMAGLGAMGMMMMRTVMLAKGGGGRGVAASVGGNEGIFGNLSNASVAQNETAALGNSLSARGAEMQEVDKLMSSSGAEHSHATFSPAIDTLENDGTVSGRGSFTVDVSPGSVSDENIDVSADVEASGSSTGGTVSLDADTVSGSEESYDVPVGAIEEDFNVSPGSVEYSSLDMNGSMDVPSSVPVMNAGSMVDIDTSSLKPQDVNMTFDDMRLRNLENMENTQARIQKLETSLPQAQETVSAYEKANATDQKTITNATNTISTNGKSINQLSKQNKWLEESLTDTSKTAQDRVQVEKQIKENTQKIQELRSESTMQVAKKEAAEKAIASRMPAYQQAQAAYDQHTIQLSAAKVAYGKQTMIERNFANAREITGGSGKVYESAAQFKDMHAMADIRKKNINYKNFDIGDNLRLLSPQERSDFHRQRATVQVTKKALSTVGMAYGGALGAAIGMFGGPAATIGGAAVGGFAGNAVGKSAGEGIMNTSYNIAEKTTPVEKPKAAVPNKVQQPQSEKKARKFTTTIQQSAKEQQTPQRDIFQEHINMAKAGDAELNARRGTRMNFTSDGKDSLTEGNKK